MKNAEKRKRRKSLPSQLHRRNHSQNLVDTFSKCFSLISQLLLRQMYDHPAFMHFYLSVLLLNVNLYFQEKGKARQMDMSLEHHRLLIYEVICLIYEVTA